MTTAVSVRGLRKSYGARTVLADVDMEIGTGVTGVLGPNGAGKTTLLRCLATALRADAGSLSLAGADPTDPAQLATIRRSIGYLPQKPGLYPHFTVGEMLQHVALLKMISDPRERADQVHRVLDLVDLADRFRTKIRKLSGGMRQRVGIAQALLGDPRILVLDEPTVGLDPEQRMQFRSLISRVGETAAVILSTHQTEDVAALCERVLVLSAGSIVFDGTPRAVAEQATGQVWLSEQRPEPTSQFWRTADGRYRSVGRRPPGGEAAPAGVEDGYLLLLSRTRDAVT